MIWKPRFSLLRKRLGSLTLSETLISYYYLVWAVIPFKQVQKAKQRLSSILSIEERRILSLKMLEDVLAAARTSDVFDKIVVATNCKEGFLVADKMGALHFETFEDSGLNSAAKKSANWLSLQGIKTMCLFPADIPLVSESEFQQIAIDHASHKGFTIVPSHDFKGTNCMLLSPPNILPFCFGMNSYAEHIRQGIKLKLSCQSKHFHGIALDIDNPNDLKKLMVATRKTQSINYLEKIKIGLRFN